MVEVEVSRFGRTWRYHITTIRNGKEEPGIMKIGLDSKQDAIQEANKMIHTIKQPGEEIVWKH
jgi:hypothetical protein